MTAGGKGANLGEMTAAGIAVPGGFVVTADAYKAFIKENHLEEMFRKELTEAGNDEAKLLDAAKKFRHAISEGKLPEEVEKTVREKYAQLGEQARVAVRSSATAEDLPDASFAGQQETYLNVRGSESVLTQIRNCFASLWGNRAVCYRSNQGYDQLSVALAVVIQKMVESEKAGVLFTVNPINRNPDEMQINASYGLGESVVSGKVTADSYLCDKQGKVKSCQIGSKETQYLWETVFYYVRKCLERTNMLLLSDTDYEHGVANLFAEELIAACERGSLSESDKEKIERRNSKHPLAQKVWDASKLLVFDADGDVLKGVSGSTGTAIGKVCIIHGPEEFYKMQKGDVLVCQLTDPEWTPLFNLASAVVADTGSSLSHAAIVAREYGIPAVLGVGLATTRFKDGDTIKVDGDKGEVSGC